MSNPTISKGFTWTNGATVMPTRLNNTADDATIQCTKTNVVLGRASSGAGEAEEIDCTAAGRALLAAADEAAQRKLVGGAALARVSTQFDKTDTTLANVTGLSVDVEAGETYSFEVSLNITQDATGRGKVAIGGTCTATAFSAATFYTATTTSGVEFIGGQPSAKDASLFVGNSQPTGNVVWMRGTITVNTGGTLTVQYAQNSANGTSSVLVGSFFRVWEYA